MNEVQPPVAPCLRIVVVGMIVRDMVLGREWHYPRILQSASEVNHSVGECNDVECRPQYVVALYHVNERLVHHRADAEHRSHGQVEKQQLVSLLQDYLRNRLVYLSVEHIVSTVVVLHRSLLRKHPHRPNEGRLHLVVLLRIRLTPVLAPQHVEAVLFTPRKLQKLGV